MHWLQALPIFLFTCSGCEAILGFGETSAATPGTTDASSTVGNVAGDRDADADSALDASNSPASAPDALHDEAQADAEGSRTDAPVDSTIGENEGPDRGTPLSPALLSGLALWLDAAVGVEETSSQVAIWHDQSPHNHLALPPYPDQSPRLLPTGIGSYPAVAFGGAGDILAIADDSSLHFGTNDFALEVVMRHSTPLSSPGCVFNGASVINKQEPGSPFRGIGLFANSGDPQPLPDIAAHLDYNTFVRADPTDGGGYNDDVPRLITMYRRGGTLTMRINGTPIGSTLIPGFATGDNIDALGVDIEIGGRRDKVQCFRGSIAEIVFASPVSEQEAISVEQYLLDKHGAALRGQ